MRQAGVMKAVVEWMEASHVDACAALFAGQYAAARVALPWLPEQRENEQSIVSRLRDLISKGPGVVALRNGQVVGYMAGMVLPAWRGRRTAFSTELDHSAEAEDRGDVYRAMYAQVAARWVADGCRTHLAAVLADQADVTDALFGLGFGMQCIDAMRGIEPVAGGPADADIRPAAGSDLATVADLIRQLRQHLRSEPIWLPIDEEPDVEEIARDLADPEHGTFLAMWKQQVIAYVQVGPANPQAAYVIQHPETASITAAFTHREHRGQEVATALLNAALEWARQRLYTRCAVDFESANVPAVRFWLRHFRPVGYSVMRQLLATS
jgi:GNAT superfamily N-acetyltransferase